MNLLVQHIPHAVPVVLVWGVLLRFWLAQRRLERRADPSQARLADGARAVTHPSISAPDASRPVAAVRRSVALRGLLALGPVLGALATGLVIYALNLGSAHAGAAAVWTHVGISLLALLLVGYKVADIGVARLRESVTGPRARRAGSSLVLLALWVPLLGSGVALLIAPGQASFTAYMHLIASVWWTGLLLWHLRRYLRLAAGAVLARPAPSRGAARVRAASASSRPPSRPAAPRAQGRTTPHAGRMSVRHRGSSAGRTSQSAQDLPIGEGSAAEDGAAAGAARGR